MRKLIRCDESVKQKNSGTLDLIVNLDNRETNLVYFHAVNVACSLRYVIPCRFFQTRKITWYSKLLDEMTATIFKMSLSEDS